LEDDKVIKDGKSACGRQLGAPLVSLASFWKS